MIWHLWLSFNFRPKRVQIKQKSLIFRNISDGEDEYFVCLFPLWKRILRDGILPQMCFA